MSKFLRVPSSLSQLYCLLTVCLVCSSPSVAIAQPSVHGFHSAFRETITAVSHNGRYTGFDLYCNGSKVVPVRFSSGGMITASTVRVTQGTTGDTMLFSGLSGDPGSGLKLTQSRISIRLRRFQYPLVSFDIHIAAFDPVLWKNRIGCQPFHFLTISMPTAKVWHHRGWLNATPLADPFPLLQDSHVGTPEISAYPYNREWSTTPPLSAHPLPVIGLWDPDDGVRKYAAWDFQETRLEDNSEKDIATGYCNHLVRGKPPTSTRPALAVSAVDRLGADKFVALVYPHGGQGYQQLIYPKSGQQISSRASLVYSTDLSSDKDPNRFLWSVWWNNPAIRSRLPKVPSRVDVSWIPAAIHLQDIPGAPDGSLITGVEGNFQVPGTRLISGWTWHNESAVKAPAIHADTARIGELVQQVNILMKYVKRFRSQGENCAFWDKPLEGRWTDDWGGSPVTTLHNASGWAAGRLLLDLYSNPETRNRDYLEIVEGVYNWTRQIVFTRNEFADVPSSPFAIGGTLAAAFLWDYYFTFRADPDPAYVSRARQAREMAVSFTYRYLNMWGSDSIRGDVLDSAFLWEPNSGRDWTGAACSNEVVWNLDTLAQTAVHTGDPVLLWALQGTLSRWHLLFQDTYRANLSSYLPSDMTEGFGLAPGNPYGYPGGRARYGFGGPLQLLDPVGESIVRIVAGEKAAIALNRGAGITGIERYTSSDPGNFAFTLKSSSHDFTATITYPFANIFDKPITIREKNGRRRTVSDGTGLQRRTNALWTVCLTGLNDGDTVTFGSGDIQAPALAVAPTPLSDAPSPETDRYGSFKTLTVPSKADWNTDWTNCDTMAGLAEGSCWINGVPFDLNHTRSMPISEARASLCSVDKRVTSVNVLYTGTAACMPKVPILTTESGEALGLIAGPCLAWRAWPPSLTARVMMASYRTPRAPSKISVRGDGGRIIAVTEATSALDIKQLEVARLAAENLIKDDRLAGSLRSLSAQLPDNRVAIIPPDSSASPANTLMGKGGFLLKMHEVTPAEMVSADSFSRERFRLTLFLGNEDYLETVNTAGDGEAALHRYLDSGGTLILMGNQPYPLYYGTAPGGVHRADPVMPRLGVPLDNAIELSLPQNLKVAASKQMLFHGLPSEFPYPQGDPRLRTISEASLPPGSHLLPIYSVIGNNGKSYGYAAALITLPAKGTATPGRILYISNILTRDPEFGGLIVQSVLTWIVKEMTPPGPVR